MAASGGAAWVGWMGAVYLYGPPPGLTDPEYSRADSRPVSIQAIPAGLRPPGGSRVGTYTTWLPCTPPPATRRAERWRRCRGAGSAPPAAAARRQAWGEPR